MKTHNITLAFSPCPNDTFIFDALINNKIDTEGLLFKYAVEDVETLNKAAFMQKYDVCKLSFHAFYHVAAHYVCLTSGAALCDNFGPVVIAKKLFKKDEFKHLTLAVPGLHTSGTLLFKHFFETKQLIPFLFSDIENAVLTDKADMGVVIHENVFSYKKKNLLALANLGNIWHKKYKLPVPLGCIAIKRNIPDSIKIKINHLIKKSIIYAFENPTSSYIFVKQNAQDTDDKIIQKHISTYVNDYSLNLNDMAKASILLLYNNWLEKNIRQSSVKEFFIN